VAEQIPFTHAGIVVGPVETDSEAVYAEIEPAGTGWLPWPGRTSRWWYEVHAVGDPDGHGVFRSTYAYQPGGSGGAFTLRSCIRKATAAIDKMAGLDA